MKKGIHIQVRIDAVGFKGVGIGTLTKELNQDADILEEELGKKVLIQNTLEGEVVIAEVTRNKTNYIEATKVSTITKSEKEIEPVCKHFSVCGGCKWQNLSYQDQLKIKSNHVEDLFTRIGAIDEPHLKKIMKPIVPSKHVWRYRNKMEMSYGFDKNMNKSFGMHEEGRRYDIFNLTECFLMSEDMLKISQIIKEFLESHNVQPFKYKENSGVFRSVYIREGTHTDMHMVEFMLSGESFDQDIEEGLIDVLKDHTDSIYITNIIAKRGTPTVRKSRLVYGISEIEEHLHIADKTYKFKISPSSFFQPNTIQAETLYQKAIDNLELKAEDRVLDLFCGTGTIGIIMSKFASDVIGVEINTDAVEDAGKNAALNGCTNTRFIAGDVLKILKEYVDLGKQEELMKRKVIIDPPRSGLTAAMVEIILSLKPSHISYVSCNPSTQARDVALFLESGFDITSIQPVDMFPHTYHIENIVSLIDKS